MEVLGITHQKGLGSVDVEQSVQTFGADDLGDPVRGNASRHREERPRRVLASPDIDERPDATPPCCGPNGKRR